MNLTAVQKNDVLVCSIEGDVDINSAPQMKKAFEAAAKNKQTKIILNLDKVPYIDSAGLATLVTVLKYTKAYGGKLKLINLSSKVRGLFEITKLEKLFSIAEGEEEAIESFS